MGTKIALIVDDDSATREVVGLHFSMMGFEVRSAGNGKAGLEALKKEPITILFLDLAMPVLDGFETLKGILECNAGAVVVAVTAFAMRGDKERALAAGFRDYITKPVEMNHLRIRVRELLA